MAYAGDLTPAEAAELLAGDPQAVLVDVRTRAEWAYVGVPQPVGPRPVVAVEWLTYPSGAPNPAFLAELADAGVTPDVPVVFLCRSGVRSVAAADAATAAGYARAYNVLEGFEGPLGGDGHRTGGWRGAGLPWRQS